MFETGGPSFTRSLVTCLERSGDQQYLGIRVQAAKLLLHVAKVSPSCVDKYTIRSITAIASAKDDALRSTMLELLRVLLPTCTEAVAQCNGIRVVFEAILDPSQSEFSKPLVLSFLHTFSAPGTRK